MADTSDAPKHKGPIEIEQKSKNMTLLVRMGSALLRPDPTDGGEQRELCGHGQDQGGGGAGATVAITAILFHRLSFIEPDKLLKELLSDCCWYAARKQPSVSVSESITPYHAREEEEGRKAERQESCSGGGSSRWQS